MKIIRDESNKIVAMRHWRAWYIDRKMMEQLDRHDSPLDSFKLYFERLEKEPKIKRIVKKPREIIRETVRGKSFRRTSKQIKQSQNSDKRQKTNGDKKPKGSVLRAVSTVATKKISRKK